MKKENKERVDKRIVGGALTVEKGVADIRAFADRVERKGKDARVYAILELFDVDPQGGKHKCEGCGKEHPELGVYGSLISYNSTMGMTEMALEQVLGTFQENGVNPVMVIAQGIAAIGGKEVGGGGVVVGSAGGGKRKGVKGGDCRVGYA